MIIAIVDGNFLMFRSYYSTISWFTNKNTNAVYGFKTALISLEKKFNINKFIVLFDKPGKKFRKQISPKYKSSREKMPDNLFKQIPKIKKYLKSREIKIVSNSKYEADDLMGILTAYLEQKQKVKKILMVSSDKDMNQLITKKTSRLYYNKKKWHEMTPESVFERYGVRPDQFADYLAIVGDKADDIEGIKGIGPKKAAQLLTKFHNIETIIEQPEFFNLGKQLLLNKKLTTILRNTI